MPPKIKCQAKDCPSEGEQDRQVYIKTTGLWCTLTLCIAHLSFYDQELALADANTYEAVTGITPKRDHYPRINKPHGQSHGKIHM